MTTPGEESQEHPTPRPGSYGEIAPGVPRYGQYAPAGWEPPQDVKDAQAALSSSAALPQASQYPGFQGGPAANTGGGSVDPQSALVPPARVILAVRLIMTAGILQAASVVALLLVLLVPAVKESVMETLRASMSDYPALTEAYADPAIVNAALFMAFVISIAMTVVYFWLAIKIRRGATWARTTALVLACFSLLMLGQLNPLSFVQIGLGLVAVVFLHRSPAKEFFLAHKARKGANL
ncbi:hypothetical protein [Arthrobacter glacialis]|uniref:DUF2127 domain-containing protein n=1 Tax=Arthrobacter glacialis TaxID=1664 RepID=A0A2S4A1H3_ARTGL|nr:hypothetical protein [Arthrobacter glacialis]POH61100.1 hypothetical protein CVS28_00935 [Arthrobacter glacialis]POH75234.1 hypothetical protein CVS27_01090 [Arthrobacter glacialis]